MAAIASLTRALDAGDLAEGIRPSALLERAIAYGRKERWADAQRDSEAALKLNPDFSKAYFMLAEAHKQLGQYDDAAESFKHAFAQSAMDGTAHMQLAWLEWESGKFRAAAEDTERAEELGAKTQYDALWEVIAHRSAGMNVRDKWLEDVDLPGSIKWPEPIVDLYLGKANPEAVRWAAKRGAENAINGQICEAAFYIAESQREHNDLAGAKSGFAEAVKTCSHHFVEYNAAQAALVFPPIASLEKDSH